MGIEGLDQGWSAGNLGRIADKAGNRRSPCKDRVADYCKDNKGENCCDRKPGLVVVALILQLAFANSLGNWKFTVGANSELHTLCEHAGFSRNSKQDAARRLTQGNHAQQQNQSKPRRDQVSGEQFSGKLSLERSCHTRSSLKD